MPSCPWNYVLATADSRTFEFGEKYDFCCCILLTAKLNSSVRLPKVLPSSGSIYCDVQLWWIAESTFRPSFYVRRYSVRSKLQVRWSCLRLPPTRLEILGEYSSHRVLWLLLACKWANYPWEGHACIMRPEKSYEGDDLIKRHSFACRGPCMKNVLLQIPDVFSGSYNLVRR